jgi:hypothetical protein
VIPSAKRTIAGLLGIRFHTFVNSVEIGCDGDAGGAADGPGVAGVGVDWLGVADVADVLGAGGAEVAVGAGVGDPGVAGGGCGDIWCPFQQL